MGGFLRTLAKVGLVELDESDQAKPAAPPAGAAGAAGADDVDMEALEKLLAEDGDIPAPGGGGDDVDALIAAAGTGAASGGAPAPPVAQPTSGMAPMAAGESGIAEGRPFDEIYQQTNVPDSPFPAEKMIKMLDGLRAMDPNTRKAAVIAMDAADDAWSVDDSVLDAQRKIQALQGATAAMAETVNQAAAQAAANLQSQDTYQSQATDSIRKQIADLEALLQEELQKVAEEKAAIDVGLKGTREAFERETARFNQEIQRLQEISVVFGGAVTTEPTSS